MCFIINDLTSVTKTIRYNNKIKLIQSLTELKDTSSDTIVVNFSKREIKNIIDNKGLIKSIVDYSFNKINKQRTSKTTQQISIESKNDSDNGFNIKHIFLFLFSSGGIFYLVAILMFPIMLSQKDKENIWSRLSDAFLIGILISSFGIFLSFICSLLPDLWVNYSIDNYLLNLLIQSVFLYFIYKSSK